jgi:hypothetical protein
LRPVDVIPNEVRSVGVIPNEVRSVGVIPNEVRKLHFNKSRSLAVLGMTRR